MAPSFEGIGGMLAAPVRAALNADMERVAVESVQPRDGERFLVIGFGAGVGLTALLDAVDPASVLALDPSEAMQRAARRRLSRHRRGARVELVKAGATDIPPGVRIDAAVAVNSHQLWRPHRDSVAAIADALRPGGRLVTLTHQWAITKRQPLQAWTAQVESDLAEVGFATPLWSEASYRSGHALGLLAKMQGDAASENRPRA